METESIIAKSKRVLFVCVHNSARSLMAEAWLNRLCSQFFVAESAGLEPGTVNPLVVEAMKEVGIDLSHKKPQGVFDLYKEGRIFSFTISVCDGANAERCPMFPGISEKIAWSFPDPSKFEGSRDEKLAQIREVRDDIREQVLLWCQSVRNQPSACCA